MKKNNLQKVFIAILLCGCSLFVSAKNVYLSASGADSNDGTSFAQAYASFSKALGEVSDDGIIYVSGMINLFNDPGNTDIEAGSGYDDTKLGIALTKSITIRGASKTTSGFTGETSQVNEYGYSMGTRFFRVGAGFTLTLKNLTFTKAYCRHTGAAVLVNGGKLIGENLIFYDNQVNAGTDASSGAAIHVDATTGISLKNCLFRKNKAQKGPGIYLADSKNPSVEINIESCSFIENEATGSPTAGAIFIRLIDVNGSLFNTVNLINCTVAKNKASANGGAIQIYAAPSSTVVSFINCTITDNATTGASSGNRGGGIMIGQSIGESAGENFCKVLIQNCIIERNTNTTVGEPPTVQAADLTACQGPSMNSVGSPSDALLISNSFIGRAETWFGNIPNECYVNSTHGYINATYNESQAQAGLDDLNEEYYVYPLKAGSKALDYGNPEFFYGLMPIEDAEYGFVYLDAINRIRFFDNEKCSAGAMEGVGLTGVSIADVDDPIPGTGIPSVLSNDVQVYQIGNQLVVNKLVESLELLNISGHLIAKKSDNAKILTIPVDNLQGIYIARIVTDGKAYTQKIVIK
jgi:hypothetical protein